MVCNAAILGNAALDDPQLPVRLEAAQETAVGHSGCPGIWQSDSQVSSVKL